MPGPDKMIEVFCTDCGKYFAVAEDEGLEACPYCNAGDWALDVDHDSIYTKQEKKED